MPIHALLKKVEAYLPRLNKDRLERAYHFAKEAHRDQKRMDGSDYITHPVAVAMILSDLHVDEDTLVATLLHDVPEDTTYTLEDVEKRFGKTPAFLVDGVTKLSKVKYRHNMAERQVESLKKFFLHSARDLRIILIKLADRLHNMRTLGAVKPEKQLRIAKETMEIHVPIANLLGLWEIKSELENLSFCYLYPQEYAEITHLLAKNEAEEAKRLQETIQKVKRELKKHGISTEIQTRSKSLYSIFRKMIDHEQSLENLNDLLALRILVKDRETCYHVLGLLHGLFRPKSGHIKDYIAVPKANGYQSLHTTVFGLDGTPTEFQIRTHSMNLESEYGIAAHYFYQQGHIPPWTKLQKELKKRSAWVKEVLELQKELKNNKDFMENLKLDVLQDRIFVFTPHGDVVDLPQGATGLDFAYHIHSDIGNHAVGLSRNGQSSTLTTPLQTGDTVRILISKAQCFPKRNWLEKAKTNLARNKIKMGLRHQTKAQATQEGLEFLQKALHYYGADFASLAVEQKKHLLQTFHFDTLPSLFEAVGKGLILESEILDTLYSKEELLGTPYRSGPDYNTALSKISYRKTPTRLIAPTFNGSLPFYRVNLLIECTDRVGLLRDLGIQLANLGVNIYQIGVEEGSRGGADTTINLVIEVVDFEQLRSVFDAMESIDGILEFHRLLPGDSSAKSAR